ncbi:4Fe-4S binding protein [Neobacillus drentensis]|uniref:4Fe-4S binding protein n=1 Tax=Neobacillus drentensis TaxID=220684 RepID=UPI0008263E54|nr:4Fe-4S binding protein [Neobacillus drentensis]
MSFLVKWLESMHVDLKITNKCSRNRNVRSNCTLCFESCKCGALEINQQSIEINQSLCTSCGDCVIACPLSAIEGIVVSREFEKKTLIYKEDYTPIEKELLIYKKRGLNAIILNGAPLNDKWKFVLAETNRKLSQLDQSPIEVVQRKNDEKLSRRDLFTSMQSGGKRLVKSLTPALWKLEANEWNLANYYPEYQFYTVELDKDKCTLCKACFTFCSQNVFQLKDTSLQIESNNCVNCTDCVDICQESAIQINTEIKGKIDYQEPIHAKKCLDCGQSFNSLQPETVKCPICVHRNPEWLSPYQ